MAGRCRDLVILQWPKTSLVHKFPCLIKLPPTNLECPASFFVSPCPPWMEPISDFTREAPEELADQQLPNTNLGTQNNVYTLYKQRTQCRGHYVRC